MKRAPPIEEQPIRFAAIGDDGKRRGGRPSGWDPRPAEDRPAVWPPLYVALLRLVRGLQDGGPAADVRELAVAVVMQSDLQIAWSKDSMPDEEALRYQNGATARARAVENAHQDLVRVGVPAIRAAALAVQAGDEGQLDLLREYLDRLESYLRTGPVRTAWTPRPVAPSGDQEAKEQREREADERLWHTVRPKTMFGGHVGLPRDPDSP